MNENNHKIIQLGNMADDTPTYKNRTRGRVYSVHGLCPTINTSGGGQREPRIIRKISNNSGDNNMTKENVLEDYAVRKLTPLECWRLMGFSDRDFLAAKVGSLEKADELINKYPNGGVEMMNEADEMKHISNSQLYKQAGNSIVVNVLYYIYKELNDAMPYLFDDLKVGSCFSGIGAFEKGLDLLYQNDINKTK